MCTQLEIYQTLTPPPTHHYVWELAKSKKPLAISKIANLENRPWSLLKTCCACFILLPFVYLFYKKLNPTINVTG